MPFRRPQQGHQASRVSMRKMLAYGAFFVLSGLLFILGELWVDEHFHVSQHYGWVGLKLADELGIALFVIGSVGIVLEFRDWNTYFQERIAETILQQKYLKTLHPDQLIQLQTNTLKAFFRIEEIDRKDSFLEFFHAKINKYIGSPYREDLRDLIEISYSADKQSFEIAETLSYKCRKVGESIQEGVQWTDTEASHIHLIAFEVQLQIPHNFFQSPEFRTRYPNVAERCITFRSGDSSHGHLVVLPGGLGYTLSLEDYREIDGLFVKETVKYRIPVSWPITWTMSHPSRGLNGTILYPPDLELVLNMFGVEEEELQKDTKPGLCVVRYDSWLLPKSGFSFDFVQCRTTAATPDTPSCQSAGVSI